jgi:hypothetical protein
LTLSKACGMILQTTLQNKAKALADRLTARCLTRVE